MDENETTARAVLADGERTWHVTYDGPSDALLIATEDLTVARLDDAAESLRVFLDARVPTAVRVPETDLDSAWVLTFFPSNRAVLLISPLGEPVAATNDASTLIEGLGKILRR